MGAFGTGPHLKWYKETEEMELFSILVLVTKVYAAVKIQQTEHLVSAFTEYKLFPNRKKLKRKNSMFQNLSLKMLC